MSARILQLVSYKCTPEDLNGACLWPPRHACSSHKENFIELRTFGRVRRCFPGTPRTSVCSSVGRSVFSSVFNKAAFLLSSLGKSLTKKLTNSLQNQENDRFLCGFIPVRIPSPELPNSSMTTRLTADPSPLSLCFSLKITYNLLRSRGQASFWFLSLDRTQSRVN